jgi:putative heme degradation protein
MLQNNRIQLLKESAQRLHDHERGGTYMKFSAEVFADILINECIKLAVFRGDKATAQAIKEHFYGVID